MDMILPNESGWWDWYEESDMEKKPERLLVSVCGSRAVIATDDEVCEAMGIDYDPEAIAASAFSFNYWEMTDCATMGGLWIKSD